MTAKYSTDDGTTVRRVEHDDRFVLATWTSKPFVGIGHRHETVEHRVVVEYSHGLGGTVRYECRSEDSGKFPDEWGVVESVELREYAARLDRQPEARWVK